MARRRAPSARTVAAQSRSFAARMAATDALKAGLVLRFSNRTDVAAGTIHRGSANRMLREGVAVRQPDPARPGWTRDALVAKP